MSSELMNEVSKAVSWRYSAKAFDSAKKLSAEQIRSIEQVLRDSPSSVNLQPWHFVLAESEEARRRLARSTTGFCSFNEPRLLTASLVVVFSTRIQVDDVFLGQLLDQEMVDRRFPDDKYRAEWHRLRSHFVNLHRFEQRDAQHWMEKQTYLCAGFLLMAVAAMGIDACPIEGFDQSVLDEELGLRAHGLASTCMVALGFRESGDNIVAPLKSRWPAERVITRL